VIDAVPAWVRPKASRLIDQQRPTGGALASCPGVDHSCHQSGDVLLVDGLFRVTKIVGRDRLSRVEVRVSHRDHVSRNATAADLCSPSFKTNRVDLHARERFRDEELQGKLDVIEL
jgi:hypothetical protein